MLIVLSESVEKIKSNLLFKILQVNKNKIFAEIGDNKKIIINNKRENCYQFLNN